MALIQCPECENQISDKASSCPKCGYEQNKPNEKVITTQQTSKNIKIIQLVSVLMVILSVVMSGKEPEFAMLLFIFGGIGFIYSIFAKWWNHE